MRLGGVVRSFCLFSLVACATTTPKREPIRPYMSAAKHEETAADYDERARVIEKGFNAGARESNGMCRGRPRTTGGDDAAPCWTSNINPTEKYLAHAKEHHRLAAEHRAAARTLRDAEARTCTGLSESDRDESLFDHREDILRVEPLHGGVSRYLNAPWTEGVVVTFKPVPGMTAEWLQRVVDCHLARNAVLGNEVPQLPHCLLVPKGVRATASAVPDGFAITIVTNDKVAAEELFRRADVLNTPITTPDPDPTKPATPTPADETTRDAGSDPPIGPPVAPGPANTTD
jgi:hypothetical protein